MSRCCSPALGEADVCEPARSSASVWSQSLGQLRAACCTCHMLHVPWEVHVALGGCTYCLLGEGAARISL